MQLFWIILFVISALITPDLLNLRHPVILGSLYIFIILALLSPDVLHFDPPLLLGIIYFLVGNLVFSYLIKKKYREKEKLTGKLSKFFSLKMICPPLILFFLLVFYYFFFLPSQSDEVSFNTFLLHFFDYSFRRSPYLIAYYYLSIAVILTGFIISAIFVTKNFTKYIERVALVFKATLMTFFIGSFLLLVMHFIYIYILALGFAH